MTTIIRRNIDKSKNDEFRHCASMLIALVVTCLAIYSIKLAQPVIPKPLSEKVEVNLCIISYDRQSLIKSWSDAAMKQGFDQTYIFEVIEYAKSVSPYKRLVSFLQNHTTPLNSFTTNNCQYYG